MTKHALALVKWVTFRGGDASGAAVYDYGSNQARLLERVADGGTLWLITSRRQKSEPRHYHLAYKLVECARVAPEASTFSGAWKYVVRAGDWRQSRHFGLNDATDTVRRLRFTSGRPMSEVSNLGLRVLSIPELTSEDVELLERLQHKIEYGRRAFLSYAHADKAMAETIESELCARDISVNRDVKFLRPGQEWEEALRQEATGADCVVVLVSPSAAESEWVRREVDWALMELNSAGGLVKSIIPVVLPQDGWEQFPQLHRFHRWDYPTGKGQAEAFTRLADGISRVQQGD